ncbi:hypothetical protein [Pararhizobium qamdonense]|uniref:hypothetical protein n=1 Tax=Pararhizobium qamdonense TaxID=3031126 RepID=UPI0023E25667|nr:hypothetical protein [Pararhizobium qamdonense]
MKRQASALSIPVRNCIRGIGTVPQTGDKQRYYLTILQVTGEIERVAKLSVILALVAGIQPAQVLELKESFDPTDVGSLDPRHKGEDDGE